MNTDDFANNIRILLRASAIRADLRFKQTAAQAVMFALAGFVGAVGLLLFILAGFLAFEQTYGPIWASVIVGGITLFLALIFAIAAANIPAGPEEELAREVQANALQAVSADLQSAGADVSATVAKVSEVVRNPFSSALSAVTGGSSSTGAAGAGGGLSAMLPTVIIPALTILLRYLRGRGGTGTGTGTI